MANVVGIVIPAHGLAERTLACLTRLREATPGGYFRVTVVDDASTDQTPSLVPEHGAALFGNRFQFIRLETNQGFARACNAGAAGSQSDFLLFLNNDTEVSEDWLPPLLSAFRESPRLGACSPLLFFPDSGRLQHAGVVFDPDLRASHLYFLFPSGHPALKRRRRLQAISASAFLLPRRLFEDLGGFFPGYVNGSEDLDLCASLRARRLELTCVPKSRIIHYTSQTPGRFEHVEANTRLLNARQTGRFAPDLADMARHDGYEIRLTPWLFPCLALPAAREEALRRADAQEAADGTAAAMEAEPLWKPGYEAAVLSHEKAGETRSAFFAARLRAHFFPSLENFAEAARLALAAGEAEGRRDALASLAAARQALARPDILAAKATAQRRHFLDAGRPDLAGLYADWLEARGLLDNPVA